MAVVDIADQGVVPEGQFVIDTSVLLALRRSDDNPHGEVVRGFMGRLRNQIDSLRAVAWLPVPVLQECYHIILSQSLRRQWETLPAAGRPVNWLAAYKQDPDVLSSGFADLAAFDQIVAAIPLTLVRPSDLAGAEMELSLAERMKYFIRTRKLLPQDALIGATAVALGATAVVTLDRDWRRVAELDIYTTPC